SAFLCFVFFFFFSSRRRHTRSKRDWSSDVCSSDLPASVFGGHLPALRVVSGTPWFRTAVAGDQSQVTRVHWLRLLAGLSWPEVEIGRASCRERVWITVVAGALKTHNGEQRVTSDAQ